jgi:hypothetical protein
MMGSSLNARVTATDMFGACMIAARPARAAISARSAGENPVVPITARAPAAATRRRCSSVASGMENSTSTRSAVMALVASVPIVTPAGPTPASTPASAPTERCPAASSAATTRNSAVSRASATMRVPMRPAAPATTRSMGFAVGAGGRPTAGESAAIAEPWSGYLTSAYCRRIPRSVSRLASPIRHIGSRNSGSSMPAIAIASLIGIGLVSRKAARASGNSR